MRIYVVFAILLASGCVERATYHPNNEAHQDAQDDTHHDSQIFLDVIHHQDVGVDGTWGPCEGEGAPSEDVCNGLDDDCDGLVDCYGPQCLTPHLSISHTLLDVFAPSEGGFPSFT